MTEDAWLAMTVEWLCGHCGARGEIEACGRRRWLEWAREIERSHLEQSRGWCWGAQEMRLRPYAAGQRRKTAKGEAR